MQPPEGLEGEAGAGSHGADPNDESSGGGSRTYKDAARALRVHGQTDEALAVLDRGIARHPDDPEMLALRGELRTESGYRRAAERDFLAALETTPHDAKLWRQLGEVRLELDLPASANQALRRCDAIAPDDPSTQALLAKAAWDCGQIEKGWTLYKRALGDGAEVSAKVLVEAASLYATPKIQERHPDDRALAFGWLYRAITRDPALAQAHYVRGVLFEGEERDDNALAAYRAALEADPGCPGASAKLALLLVERGDVAEARIFADRALEDERDGDVRRVLQEIVYASSSFSTSSSSSSEI